MTTANADLLEAERKIHSARDNKLHLILDVMDIRFRPIKQILENREATIEGYFNCRPGDVRDNYLTLFIHCNRQLKDFLGI